MAQPLNPPERLVEAPLDPVSETRSLGVWTAQDRVGPYEVLRLIGRGGMGEVYAAKRIEDPDAGPSRVALKRLRADLSTDPKFVELFEHEAAVHALAAHPNVIRLLEFGRFGDEPVMVLEYVDGISCRRALQVAKERGIPCPLGGALYMMHEVLRALEHIHALRDASGRSLRVVHRDVTPGNVLVGRCGEIKLADFGVVRSELTTSGTRPGVLKGKVGYMSPEQILGAELDARSDLFSVGVMLAEMLLARRLFQRATDFRLMIANYKCDTGGALEMLPRQLGEIWNKTLQRLPGERARTAADLRHIVTQTAQRLRVDMTSGLLLDWFARLGLLPSSSGTFAAAPFGEELDPARVSLRSPLPMPSAWRASLPRPLAAVGLGADVHCQIHSQRLGQPVVRVGGLAAAVATGRVPQSVSIAPKDGETRPLSAWLPRAAFATAGAFDYSGDHDGEPIWSHRIDPLTLPAMLFEIRLRRRTGLLVVEKGRAKRRVYFSDGEVVFVASTVQRELLGMRLVASRRATGDCVRRALDHACRRGLFLGEAMVDLDLIRPGLVIVELVSQIEDRFVAIGRMNADRVSFHPGRAPGVDAAPPRISTEELVCRLVRESFTLDDLARAVGPFADERPFRTEGREMGFLEGLNGAESQWLDEMGRSEGSLKAMLAQRSPSERLVILRAAFLGISAGLLRFE